jgi:hypothetical protein
MNSGVNGAFDSKKETIESTSGFASLLVVDLYTFLTYDSKKTFTATL